MCGRYVLTADTRALLREFDATLLEPMDWQPRYNIAPTQLAPVIVLDEHGSRSLRLMRWGLIPHWSKDESIASKLINCRSETAAEKPSFRAAFAARRCLVPASGFYEWKPAQPGASRLGKTPHWIHPQGGKSLALAGLWESWQPPDGPGGTSAIQTFTLLTTEANPFMKDIHDRMPRILTRKEQSAWLDPSTPAGVLKELASTPYAQEDLAANPVSTKVNSPANEGPELIRATRPRKPAQGNLPGLFVLGLFALGQLFAGGCAITMTRPCSEGGDVSWRSSRTKDGTIKGDKHCVQKLSPTGQYLNHGAYSVTYANGKKAIEGRFEEGKKEGFWSEFDEKGSKVAERYFEAGVEKAPPSSSADRKSK